MRVLIVEDDALIAADLAATVADGGHQVVAVAERLPEALAAAAVGDIDLAFVDLGLKDGGSGIEVVRALRARHAIPAIVVSAERELPTKARAAGAVGYISKPARPAEILRFIRAMDSPKSAFC